MDVKAIFIFVTLVANASVLALKDCRDIPEIKVLNNYLDYKYRYEEGKPILTSKTKIRRPLVRHWSNVSSKLFEIYFQFTNKKYEVTGVTIKYIFNKKIIYNKKYKMKSFQKGLLEIDKYSFNDGVLKPEFRPGHQLYTFSKNDKPICEIKVSHFFGTEY
jgi:hypothetical protein